MTAAAKHINHLQGRSLASSNDVGKSLRRTRGAKDFFESTLMYKANEQFIKRIKDEDYTIIHIGQTTDSYFCDMENELIKDLNWIEKNLKWKE